MKLLQLSHSHFHPITWPIAAISSSHYHSHNRLRDFNITERTAIELNATKAYREEETANSHFGELSVAELAVSKYPLKRTEQHKIVQMFWIPVQKQLIGIIAGNNSGVLSAADRTPSLYFPRPIVARVGSRFRFQRTTTSSSRTIFSCVVISMNSQIPNPPPPHTNFPLPHPPYIRYLFSPPTI